MQLWTPPSHRVFMSTSYEVKATPITNTLFGAFCLALDRLQQLPPGDVTRLGEGVAMVDPAAVECVLRRWATLNLFGRFLRQWFFTERLFLIF